MSLERNAALYEKRCGGTYALAADASGVGLASSRLKSRNVALYDEQLCGGGTSDDASRRAACW